MAQQHQAAVTVLLVLTASHKTERRRTASCRTDRHSEAIEESSGSNRLTAVGDRTVAAQSISVVERTGRTPSLTQTRRVGRRSIGEYRTGCSVAIGDVVLGAYRIYLLDAQIVAVVRETVGR